MKPRPTDCASLPGIKEQRRHTRVEHLYQLAMRNRCGGALRRGSRPPEALAAELAAALDGRNHCAAHPVAGEG